ncbi:MAG: CoA pyrophosphatase [Gammaproteobacteria bacterium]|nr:CoA pyrophosphatase [Gammaproteobacteria bacterium]
MRALIEKQLARAPNQADPLSRLLAQADGPVSQDLLDLLSDAPTSAAVLLGLVERPGGLHVILTERAADLADHPGQVSFPGGRIEDGDDGPVAAALREAEEEVQLRPDLVSIAGCLEDILTGTGFLITPVVGFVASEFRAVPDRTEVADVFEVPLEFLLREDSVRSSMRERCGTTLRIYEFDYAGHHVWGATAMILRNFVQIIKQ